MKITPQRIAEGLFFMPPSNLVEKRLWRINMDFRILLDALKKLHKEELDKHRSICKKAELLSRFPSFKAFDKVPAIDRYQFLLMAPLKLGMKVNDFTDVQLFTVLMEPHAELELISQRDFMRLGPKHKQLLLLKRKDWLGHKWFQETVFDYKNLAILLGRYGNYLPTLDLSFLTKHQRYRLAKQHPFILDWNYPIEELNTNEAERLAEARPDLYPMFRNKGLLSGRYIYEGGPKMAEIDYMAVPTKSLAIDIVRDRNLLRNLIVRNRLNSDLICMLIDMDRTLLSFLPLDRLSSQAIKNLINKDPSIATVLPTDNLTGQHLKMLVSRHPSLLDSLGKEYVASKLILEIIHEIPDLAGYLDSTLLLDRHQDQIDLVDSPVVQESLFAAS